MEELSKKEKGLMEMGDSCWGWGDIRGLNGNRKNYNKKIKIKAIRISRFTPDCFMFFLCFSLYL